MKTERFSDLVIDFLIGFAVLLVLAGLIYRL